jgi:Major Facilitator Superfamily
LLRPLLDVHGQELVSVFLRWNWWRAVLHRGWWLVASVYLVVDAGLSASQLVLIGVAQGGVALLFEVPAGVVADTISRKWSLVVSQALMGSSMIATGLVTDFPSLVATQMLWGFSWNFASGADVAWVTDELDQPAIISAVLMRSGRAQLTGAAAGLVGIGAVAWLTQRSTAMVLAGSGMLVLGLYVAVRFPEQRFVPTTARRWGSSWAILVRGTRLMRRNRTILAMVAASFLLNGAATFGRLYPLRLIQIGLPLDPVAWFTVLGVLALLVGAAAFSAVEPLVGDARGARRGYVLACATGAVGVVAFVVAPEGVSASLAALVVAGITLPLTTTMGTIWVNREATAEVRATVHSFVAQAEYVGEIVCGAAIAVIAQLAGLRSALATCGALFVITIILIHQIAWRRGSG